MIQDTGLDPELTASASVNNGSKARQLTRRGFERLADADGFLVAYPDSNERHWNDGLRELILLRAELARSSTARATFAPSAS